MIRNNFFKFFVVLFFTTCPLFIFSQYKIQYQYFSRPDVSKRDSIIHEIMTLDVDLKSKKSNFYSENKLKVDSIILNVKKKDYQKIKFPAYNPNLIYNITKDILKGEVVFHITYSGIRMKITETQKPIWKINNEKIKIGDFVCQKATTYYKGREWIAWFTSEIPISEGPYKFYGLPGLIVKIHDKNNEHIFDILKVKKDESIKVLINKGLEKEISTKQLNKILDDGYKNVNQNIKGMYINKNGYSFVLNDGNILFIDKKVKNVEKELEKKMQRPQNPIEL